MSRRSAPSSRSSARRCSRTASASDNIQGIGDKHIPLIHNVYNTDFVAAVSDRATDQLSLLFAEPSGRARTSRAARGVPVNALGILDDFGLSSICNVVAAVKVAKHLGLGRTTLS